MKKILLSLLIVVSLCFAQIRIAAASNLYESLDSIKFVYEAKTDKKLYINYASSGTLTNQIIQANNYDLFLSADTVYPKYISKVKNLREEMKIFSYATIILWKKKKSLSFVSAKQIAIANPILAPYGKISLQYLKKELTYNAFKKKLIYAQNVSQVNQHIKLGTVDLALTSVSAQYYRCIKKGVWEEIKSTYFPQGLVVLKQNEGASQFSQFLFSKISQSIFVSFGYRIHE